jgi:exopolysaccharide biosynthesis polyprenyl glycosylphosphotransferase
MLNPQIEERRRSLLRHTAESRRGGPRFRRTRFTGPSERPALPAQLLEERGALAGIRRRDRIFRSAVVSADVVAAFLVAGLAMAWLPSRVLSWSVLLLVPTVPLVNWAHGLYQRDARLLNKSTLDEAPMIFRGVTVATVISYLAQSALLHAPIGAQALGFVWIALTVSVLACRMLARAAVRGWLPPERCLVLGEESSGDHLAAKLESAVGVKSEMVGVLALPGRGEAAALASPESSLAEAVVRLDVHRVVVAAGSSQTAEHELEAIQAAKALGVKVSVLPRVLEVVGSSATFDFVDGLTFLGVPQFGLSRPAEFVKRCFDIVGSVLLLVIAGPLMALIALAIKLTSPGPVCFQQMRIGRNGHAFAVLKFRSMHDGADRLKDSLREHNEQEGLFKIADDPRITRVGSWLRRTSLDELPQLFNVLRGEMSLVGPRPLVPEEDRQIQGWHRRRLHLTPGMTGPWQVLGSSRIPLGEMVTIDYLYVANWSLWNDVKIMLRTVATVVARRGR